MTATNLHPLRARPLPVASRGPAFHGGQCDAGEATTIIGGRR